ncbi:hypothetical protein SAMN05421820_10422 [Pedobacter steynii]|uniref:Uncharacterized protein n=1 Tax=Pedobacter steynii TaxID=430522 RepID=A0A1G9U0S0_9SPHI|nr:hypothetical protein SAMN05421820_10422 [Pedobacter steynii]
MLVNKQVVFFGNIVAIGLHANDLTIFYRISPSVFKYTKWMLLKYIGFYAVSSFWKGTGEGFYIFEGFCG